MSRWWRQSISFKISRVQYNYECSIIFHHDTKPEDYSLISNLAKSSGTTADRGRSRWESFRWGSGPNRASTWLDKESFYHNESCLRTAKLLCISVAGCSFIKHLPTLYTWNPSTADFVTNSQSCSSVIILLRFCQQRTQSGISWSQ